MLCLLGWDWRRTMPPIFTEPLSFGLNGSDTSYCCSSPVPQQETYRYRSSSERFRSVTNGGTALNPFSSGGSNSGSAGSGGISIPSRTLHSPLPFCLSLCQTQTDAERSFSDVTTPRNPYASPGSCAGRNSSTI